MGSEIHKLPVALSCNYKGLEYVARPCNRSVRFLPVSLMAWFSE